MMNVLFGLLTALFVAAWGVAWYRQQSPAAVARGRLAPRPSRPVAPPAPRERVDRLVPLTRAAAEPEMERIEEPFFAASAPPRPRSPQRLRRPALTPIPEGPRLAVEPLTADERLGDFTPPRPLAPPEPLAVEGADGLASEAADAIDVPPPPAEPTASVEGTAAPRPADPTADADDLAAIEEPFFDPPAAPSSPTADDLAAIEEPFFEPPTAPSPTAEDLAAIEEPFIAAPPAPLSTAPVETPPPAPPVATGATLDGIAEPFFGVERAPAPELVGYCARCQARRSVRDVIQTTTRKGRPALRGHCATCGAGMFIFVADER